MARDVEKQLNRSFGEAVRTRPDFFAWVLAQTHLSRCEPTQVYINDTWPWRKSPTTGRESETDILVVFTDARDGFRIALHIETKHGGDRFDPKKDQAAEYRHRAAEGTDYPKWTGYQGWTTVLLAPDSIVARFPNDAGLFDHHIRFEGIGRWLPVFLDHL